ncbi:hypothetical protein SAMD00079811_71740 [Scytonema sp. HK-05]|nr:hypothetical protein SAMD00079811_71740 [Scytonema sp. HK-05]
MGDGKRLYYIRLNNRAEISSKGFSPFPPKQGLKSLLEKSLILGNFPNMILNT